MGEEKARTWSAKVKRSGGKALEGLGMLKCKYIRRRKKEEEFRVLHSFFHSPLILSRKLTMIIFPSLLSLRTMRSMDGKEIKR